MANTNSPYGFRQIAGAGSSPTFEQVAYNMAYNASACYFGDPVTLQADGTVAVSASTGATPAALGIGGIFMGCKYLSVSQKRTVWSNYWPGSDVASGNFVTAYICNDPNARFIVQSDSTGLAAVDVNATIGFAIGTGSSTTGISGAYLDSTTINTSSYVDKNPFKVFGIYDNPPGAPGTLTSGQAYDWVIVGFNNENTRNLQGV